MRIKKTGEYLRCHVCNQKFYAMPYQVKSGRKYCSGKCRLKVFASNRKGVPCTEETKKRISKANKGRQPSLLAIRGATKSARERRGKKHPRWKGGKPKCKKCGKQLSNYGIFLCKKCYNESKKGIPRTQKVKDKISRTHKERWKMHKYKTLLNERMRRGKDFAKWRKKVFERDNYICQKCKKRSKKGERIELHPHHILNFSNHEDLRFIVDNGVTLCVECHQEFHKRYGWINNNEWQMKEFIITSRK